MLRKVHPAVTGPKNLQKTRVRVGGRHVGIVYILFAVKTMEVNEAVHKERVEYSKALSV